jgi:hypothetical protein
MRLRNASGIRREEFFFFFFSDWTQYSFIFSTMERSGPNFFNDEEIRLSRLVLEEETRPQLSWVGVGWGVKKPHPAI